MKQLSNYTDRELLELVYLLCTYILSKVTEIDDDTKLFGMNVAANLLSNTMQERKQVQ